MNSVETEHSGIESLIQRVDPSSTPSDLPLTQGQVEQLHSIAQELIAESAPEFHGPSTWEARHGDVALFVGPVGTGKKTAAKVIARKLGSQLIRLRLVDVFGEFPGGTEKNLEAVFHAATNAGAIILFDEADALFDKRSDVKDGHSHFAPDSRFAPIEADWLVRRIEAYPGLVILGCLTLPAHWKKLSLVVNFGPAAWGKG